MVLQALLVSRDPQAVSILQIALRDLRVEAEVCPDLQPAVERLAEGGTAVVLVDYEVEHATELLKLVRQNYAGSCVALAMVKGLPSIQAAYELGANFVLIKAITMESASRSLAEAVALASRLVERRARLVVPTLAYVHFEGARDAAIILDLGEGGMAVQSLQPIEPKVPLRVKFDLPGSLQTVDAGCEIVWADSTGRAGLRFTDLSEEVRQALQGWLRSNGAKEKSPVQLKKDSVPVILTEAAVGRNEPLHVPPVAQRVFSGLVDGIVILLASVTFFAVFWLWTRDLPVSPSSLPVGLAVPFLLTIVYFYLFMAHPRGTPGMHLAEKGSQAARAPEIHDVSAPRLVAASSRVLLWLESCGRDIPSAPRGLGSGRPLALSAGEKTAENPVFRA